MKGTTPGGIRAAQLITYADSLGGSLEALDGLLTTELAGCFPGGVHVLPPFPSSGDRGFSPITYDELDSRFGDWDDLSAVARHGDLTLDIMVNHISRRSNQFEAFEREGRAAADADLFITLDKVWPDGEPSPADIGQIFLRKPDHPFSDITIATTGDVERIWTSFGPPAGQSEQIDLDVTSPATWRLFEEWFCDLAARGVSAIRLDAVGYVIKRAGTSCFMVEPEIFTFLEDIDRLAARHGLRILPEVHATRDVFESITGRGFTTYNFVLPGLILHGLATGRGDLVQTELRASVDNQVTMLDCHDGIPVQPDLTGVLPVAELENLVATCVDRGANVAGLFGAAPGTFDAHQINVTYRSACGSDEAYLAARALQLFSPGTPQVYYVGLLGGLNDHQAIDEQQDGRAVNRHNYGLAEARAALASPLGRAQLKLLELRATHPAFAGSWSIPARPDTVVAIRWSNGPASCELEVDFATGTHHIITGVDRGRGRAV